MITRAQAVDILRDHSRDGKQISTSALLAVADAAATVAICSARSGYVPMTAIQQSASFFHPVLGQDVLDHAGITRLGEDLAFAHGTLIPAGSSDQAAQTSAVYRIDS